jgi:hypothetical protein
VGRGKTRDVDACLAGVGLRLTGRAWSFRPSRLDFVGTNSTSFAYSCSARLPGLDVPLVLMIVGSVQGTNRGNILANNMIGVQQSR